MTSVANYAIAIAAALLAAAAASLAYVLYIHTTAPKPAPTTVPPTSPAATPTATTPPPTTTSTATTEATRILHVALYISTPNVTRCAGIGPRYIYYFNITVDRKRLEDPVSVYVFKAASANATYDLTTAALLPLNRYYFKPYSQAELNRTGVVNVYLELVSSAPLQIDAVEYLGKRYPIEKVVYVACVKRIEIRGAFNRTALTQGSLNLIPTDVPYVVNITVPPGLYRIAAPPDVEVTPATLQGGGNATLVIKFVNKPLVYDPLILEARQER